MKSRRASVSGNMKSVARLVLSIDFKHSRLVSDMWRDKIREAMERQKIFFDLENNDSSGDPFVVKAGEYDWPTGPGTSEMVPYRFIVQECKAGGDWENPVLYYRIQVHPKSQNPNGGIFNYNSDKCMCYIPVEGNHNLLVASRENEDGTKYPVLSPSHNGEGFDDVEIDEKLCKQDLIAFLTEFVKLPRGPGWEDEPELNFKNGKLVTASVRDLEDLAQFHCQDGVWDYSEYTRGLVNGMILSLHTVNDLKGMPDFFPPKGKYPTFMELHEQAAKTGDHHHLRLHCVLCGNTETCRCSAPKMDVEGICYECSHKDDQK